MNDSDKEIIQQTIKHSQKRVKSKDEWGTIVIKTFCSSQ